MCKYLNSIQTKSSKTIISYRLCVLKYATVRYNDVFYNEYCSNKFCQFATVKDKRFFIQPNNHNVYLVFFITNVTIKFLKMSLISNIKILTIIMAANFKNKQN